MFKLGLCLILSLVAFDVRAQEMDISDIDRQYLHKNIGMVLQEPFLFSRTLAENIGIAELAETLHVHKGHLGEQLKKACGKSFRTMLAERRVDEAKVYLKRQQHLSIAHIATLCGFPDSNYFSTVFHRCTGMTPTDYRLQADND